jgi:DNA-binding XRE family transcriptional regulator
MVQFCTTMSKSKPELAKLKEWAKILYTKDNRTQKDIAATIGVSPKTVNQWVADGKWDSIKKSLLKTKEEQLKELYAQLDEFNLYIKNKPEGMRFPDSKEADALKKITSSCKDLESELGINTIIDVFIEFLNFLRPIDFTKAQEIADLQDEFIKRKMK